jgi:hypothetical protein
MARRRRSNDHADCRADVSTGALSEGVFDSLQLVHRRLQSWSVGSELTVRDVTACAVCSPAAATTGKRQLELRYEFARETHRGYGSGDGDGDGISRW